MPKRSAEDKIKKYYEKIKKLENKKLSSLIENPEEEDTQGENIEEVQTYETDQEPFLEPVPEPIIESELIASNTLSCENEEISPELMLALGSSTADSPEYGSKINKTLADLWTPLLKKGLSKEDKEKLVKEYCVPENCKLLQAPKLNPEISAAVTDGLRYRDKKLDKMQQLLGQGTTAINRAMDILLKNEENVTALKHLSDGCRLLIDLHYSFTKERIKILSPNLDQSIKQVISEAERDETLFGITLSENIKASKAIQRQGNQIKKTVPRMASHTTTTLQRGRTSAYVNQGNWMGPPRFPSNRGGRGGFRQPAPIPIQRRPYQPGQMRYTNQVKVRAPARQ